LAQELAIASPEPPTMPLPRASGVEATEVLAPATRVRTRPMMPPPRRDFAFPRGRGFWLGMVAVVAAIAIAVAIALAAQGGGGGSSTPSQPQKIEPVPAASDPAGQARNFADWLREHSR
jgi:hypothetical protein